MRWTDANASRFWRRFRLAERAPRLIVPPKFNFRIAAANRAPSSASAKNGAGTVMNTGVIGGINWGGASIIGNRGHAIANVVNMPTMIHVTEGPMPCGRMAPIASSPATSVSLIAMAAPAPAPDKERRRSANDNFVLHQMLMAFAGESQAGDDMGLAQWDSNS